jgi:succinoglycan biosynthesis transport protein ExoP
MESTKFPLEKTNGERFPQETERRPRLHQYVDVPEVELAGIARRNNLLEYWYTLFRNRRTLSCFALAGLLIAILYSLAQTPLYRARTSLEIQDFNDEFLDTKNVDPTSTGNYLTAQSFFQTQIKMLQSESLLGRVVDKLNLERVQPKNEQNSLSGVRQLLTPFHSPEPSAKEALIQQVGDNLTVRPAGETRLVEVFYQSPNRKLAADFANTLVGEYIAQSQEMRWESTQRTAEWLTRHLDDMKVELEQLEAQLQDYARTSGLTFTSDKDEAADMRLAELEQELSKAQADRIAKEANLEGAKSKPADSLPEMLDDPTLRDYHIKLTELERQLVDLSTTLTPEHFKVQRVQAQIGELQSAIQTERANVLHRLSNEDATARRREQSLTKAYEEQQKQAEDQAIKAIHYNTLKREVESSRELYQQMLQRVKQAGLAAAMRASNIVLVDPAKPPLLPYKPRVLMNSVLGLLSGVFLGIGFVLVWECADRRIQAPGDAQVYLNLPELGVIPIAEISGSRQILKGFLTSPKHARASRYAVARRVSPEMATWQNNGSLMAECVQTTISSILRPGQNGQGNPPCVLVVTSPGPREGKTTVASNLAIAIAEIGRRVLLIDGDLRRPRLHRIFGVSSDWGLSDVLSADSRLATEPIEQLVCETKISRLALMPSGYGAVNPLKLFYTPRMAELLTRLRSHFEIIIIDTPPIVHLADARVLARLADGVVLVVRAGKTTTESALFAVQSFAEDETRVLGTILNSFDPNSTGPFGYRSYNAYFKQYAQREN